MSYAVAALAVALFLCAFGLWRLGAGVHRIAGALADLADTQLERNGIERRRTN